MSLFSAFEASGDDHVSQAYVSLREREMGESEKWNEKKAKQKGERHRGRDLERGRHRRREREGRRGIKERETKRDRARERASSGDENGPSLLWEHNLLCCSDVRRPTTWPVLISEQ